MKKTIKPIIMTVFVLSLLVMLFACGGTYSFSGTVSNGASYGATKDGLYSTHSSMDGTLSTKFNFKKGEKIKFSVVNNSLSGTFNVTLTNNDGAETTIHDGTIYEVKTDAKLKLSVKVKNHEKGFKVTFATLAE